jgi:hypothetical protein
LTPISPTLATLGASAASVLQVWPGPPQVAVTPAQLELQFTDDVNAIAASFAGCCIGIRGNVDGSGVDDPNIADLTFLVDYLFRGGLPPPCMEEGNVDGDPGEQVNVADLTYLVDYLFRGGPPPPYCPC